jgi:sugar phosphate isomerase/epimerase
LPYGSVLDLIKAMEFDGVDVGLFQGSAHIQPYTAFRDLRKNAADLSYKLKSRGLAFADIFFQAENASLLAINHPDEAVRKKVRELFNKATEFTLECGCKHLTIVPGVYFDSETKEVSFKRCCEELAWRCLKADEAGISFSIEAHVGSIVPTPEEALTLVKSVPGLTLTLDYCHFIRDGISEERIEPLIKYASHFHARGASKGRLQTSVSENTIDYGHILREMKRVDYPGFIGIEYVWAEWENCNRVDNVSETILLRDYLRKIIKSPR